MYKKLSNIFLHVLRLFRSNKQCCFMAINDEIKRCQNNVEQLTEELVPLYNYIEKMIFPHDDHFLFKGLIPLWMVDAGRSAESPIDKPTFEKYIRIVNSTSNVTAIKYLYWCDVEALLNALQDRIFNISWMLHDFYKRLSPNQKYSDNQYTSALMLHNSETDWLYTLANSIFVSLASAFDIFTKLAFEIEHFDTYSFNAYGKMRSIGVLFNKNAQVSSSLKQEGLLFSEPTIIRTIETLRSEYIHNGPWDRRVGIYVARVNDTIADEFMYMPDIDANGQLECCGGRRKFYATNKKLNVELYKIVNEVVEVLRNTFSEFRTIVQNKIDQSNLDLSQSYMEDIIKLNSDISAM